MVVLLTDKQKRMIEESTAKANPDADYKPWENSTQDAEGMTNAQWSAFWAGEDSRVMPKQVRADRALLSAYMDGLKRASQSLQGLINGLDDDFKECESVGESSAYFKDTGHLLSAIAYQGLRAKMERLLALDVKLMAAAQVASKDLRSVSNASKVHAFLSNEGSACLSV